MSSLVSARPIGGSMYDRYRVSIEAMENGFAVEIPDFEAMAKKSKEAKKKGDMHPYLGDCTKKFVAKTTKEALKLISTALEQLPDAEYSSAFEEAAGK